MKMPPEQALGQLTVFPRNRNHAPFMLCLSRQGACFPILLIIQPRVLEKTQGVNGKGWCLWAPDRNCYLARRWSLPSFQKETIAFFFFAKLNDREADLSGKRICKPEALFANKSPFRTAFPVHLPMQQEPCKAIMVATEIQLQTTETHKEKEPNSCLSPSKQTNRQK